MSRGSSRRAAIATAARLFQEQGYAATGVAEVIERSGTPKGSFYFNFPGGKRELAREALAHAGDQLTAAIDQVADATSSPREFVEALTATLAAGLEASDFSRGCPITTVSLETSSSAAELRDTAAAQFAAWESAIAHGLAAGGRVRARERWTAKQLLMLIEGALILSRVRRDTEPVRSVARMVMWA